MTSPHEQTTDISTEEILNVATLSRLAVSEDTAQHYAQDISKILGMMNTLASVDTEGVAPLANIHENQQDLRQDVADNDIDRDRNQSVAPATENGFYLVPQVIE